MATLTTQPILNTGTVVTYAAAAAGGDKVSPGDNVWLEVANASGGNVTVTVNSQTPSNYGTDEDLVTVCATGVTTRIGKFPASRFAAAADGLVSITYSAVTSVTVAAVSA